MKIESKSIDHLGIVSGICDKIKLVEIIDSIIPKTNTMQLSVGTRIKAMIINGLGFTGRPLYITEDFYKTKPVTILLGKGVNADQLNDDALGRALDALYKNDAEYVFTRVAAEAIRTYNITIKTTHYDTTTISVDGKYDQEDGEQIVKFGYSKDLRNDLKQIVLGALAANDGGIPLLVKILPGNTSDSKHFKNTLQILKENAFVENPEFKLVFDSAGYNAETIASLCGIKWVTRVPDTIGEAQNLKHITDLKSLQKIDETYSISETTSQYAGINQRWVIVHSKKAFNREINTINRAVLKEEENINKQIKALSKKKFACKKDAEDSVKDLQKKLKYHKSIITVVHEKKSFELPGKPKNGSSFKLIYSPEIALIKDEEVINQIVKKKSMFIIATNDLNQNYNAENILTTYKDQYKIETGFRFLKNPLCMAKSIYLKNQSRIIALGVVMFLCLLVYSIAERALRSALVDNNVSVRNQVKKQVKNPTMRWIFQMMEDVTILRYEVDGSSVLQVANLTDELKKIITLLGVECMSNYLLQWHSS
jgi:transposase